MMELSPDRKARFEKILAQYPVKRSALLPLLALIQEQEGYLSRDALVFAGPFLKDDCKTMCGSLVVIEAPSLEAARAIAAGDPFAKAGLFERVEIRPWLWLMNKPERP